MQLWARFGGLKQHKGLNLAGGGTEIRGISVLSGASAERAVLHLLLRQKVHAQGLCHAPD